MKKLLLPLIFMLTGFLAKAQFTPSNLNYYEKYTRPIDALYVQIGGGLSLPVGQWGAAPAANQAVLDPFVGEDGMGAEKGYFVNLSMQVPLSYKADFANKSYMGLRWGIEYADHGYIEWSEVISNSYSTLNAFNLSIVLGPNYNINLNNKVVLELETSLRLSIVSGQPELIADNFQTGEKDEYSFNITPEVPEEGNEMTWKPGWTASIGLRLRHWRFYAQYYKQGVEQYYTYTTYDSQGNESVKDF
jgi:hypothetical protein